MERTLYLLGNGLGLRAAMGEMMRASVLAALVLLIGLPQSLWAQTLPSQVLPRNTDISSGLIQNPDGSIDVPALRLPETGAPAGAEDLSFQLNAVRVDGATVYSDAELQALYGDLLNREVTLLDAFAIAQAIEARYRGDGYVLSRAVVPPQTIEDGVFQVNVIEGHIDGITYVGDVGPVKSRIDSYLSNLLAFKPINIAEIERYLLLSNDLPGLVVRGVLQPSTESQGAAQLVVNLERKQFNGFARVDNRESRFTGRSQGIVSIAANSFTDWGDRSEFTLLGSSEISENKHFGTSFETFIDDEGTSAEA